MPVYEYVCNNCNDRFDRLVRNGGASQQIHCERCASEDIRRVMSGFAMVGGVAAGMQLTNAPSSGGCCGGGCGCGGHA